MDKFYPPISQVGFSWDAWLDLPFADKGRGPEFYDCWGLVRAVIWAGLQIELPSFLEYEDTRIDGDVVNVIQAHRENSYGFEIPLAQAQIFDVLILRINGFNNHIGVVVKRGKFLHTQAKTGSRMNRYTDLNYASRIEGCYRVNR